MAMMDVNTIAAYSGEPAAQSIYLGRRAVLRWGRGARARAPPDSLVAPLPDSKAS